MMKVRNDFVYSNGYGYQSNVNNQQTNHYGNLPQFTGEDAYVSNPDEKNKKKHTARNIIIGALALAGTVAVGIIRHKNIKLNKEIDKLTGRIKEVFVNRYNIAHPENQIWDTKILEKQIADVEKLPKKERLARLKEIDDVISKDRGFSFDLHRENPELKTINVEKLPKELQDAIQSGDRYTASKMYAEYCDTIFYDSTTTGKNLGEVLENVFGKETPVKPHGYDISKEAPSLATCNNTSGAGYQCRAVTSENKIAAGCNWKATEDIVHPRNCYSYGVAGHLPEGSTTPIIQSGVTEGGCKYVGITYYGNDGRNVAHGFTLYAPKGQDFTPAQKDLLSIDTSKLTKEDLDILCNMPRGAKDSNYDVVLSVVKHLADKFRG